jgi:hypothetical protein
MRGLGVSNMIRPYKQPYITGVSFSGDTYQNCLWRQWAVDLLNSLRSNPDAWNSGPVVQRLSRKTDKEECVTQGAEYDANTDPFSPHAAWYDSYPTAACMTNATGQCSVPGWPATWNSVRSAIYQMYGEKTEAGCDNPPNYCVQCGHWYIMMDPTATKVAIGFFNGVGVSYNTYINMNFYSA